MRLFKNGRPARALKSAAAAILLAAAALTSPRLQAQDKVARRPAAQTPAAAKNAGPSKQSDAWGPERNGLRTRLLHAQKEYVVGQPAKFRLEMKNVGKKMATYDSQQVDVNASLRITDPDGKTVPYVGGSVQTTRPWPYESIAPGATEVLFDETDFSGQYLFVKPGAYTLQFRGTNVKWDSESEIPPSGKIVVQMQPGKLPTAVQVPARLLEIIPDGWNLSLSGGVGEVVDGKITPPGWEPGKGTYVKFVRHATYTDSVLRMGVWVTERKLAWTGRTRTATVAKPDETATYLGKGVDGHVYLKVPERAELERVTACIRKALAFHKSTGIEDDTKLPAEAEWLDMPAKLGTALQIETRAAEHGASK